MSKATTAKAPAGSCDTHIHFYNGRFPAAGGALINPPDAWVDDYKAVQLRLGLERVVVVQPTTYGRDNNCQLEAMAALGDSARGVMVVDDTASDASLEDLTNRGVRGVRFHMLPGGALPWALLEVVAPRVHAHGWHVQLQLNGRDLEDRLDRLKALPCGLVVDHVGRFMSPAALYGFEG